MNTYNKKQILRIIALFMAVNLVVEIVAPSVAYALTGGPSQPEVQSFEAVGTSQMVDLFTGDFTYNIPLFELPGPNGGYPFNLAYQAGIGMDQEASWVGLGWTLNPGAITRQMRGLPDDLNGEEVTKHLYMKPNVTLGVSLGTGLEIMGKPTPFDISGTVMYNSHKGISYSVKPSLNLKTPGTKQIETVSDNNEVIQKTVSNKLTAGLNIGMGFSTEDGITTQYSVSLASNFDYTKNKLNANASLAFSGGFNSREGLTHSVLGVTASRKTKNNLRVSLMSGSSPLWTNSIGYTPTVQSPMKANNYDLTIKAGGSIAGIFINETLNGFYSKQYICDGDCNGPQVTTVNHKAYGYMYLDKADPSDHKIMMDFNREKDGMLVEESPNLAMPTLTNDIYTLNGQGLSGMFRPYRSDIGIVFDPGYEFTAKSDALGIDIGVGATPHLGVNYTGSRVKKQSGPWSGYTGDFNHTILGYKNKADLHSIESEAVAYEPYHFKIHGEPTAQAGFDRFALGGDKAILLDIDDQGHVGNTLRQNQAGLDWQRPLSIGDADKNAMQVRQPQTTGIVPVTNNQLIDENGYTRLTPYAIRFRDLANGGGIDETHTHGSVLESDEMLPPVDETATEYYYRRTADDRIGGFTALNPNGVRYVYGLPAYNIQHVENQFSVKYQGASNKSGVNDNDVPALASENDMAGFPGAKQNDDTEQFLDKTEIPPYAHSYLLTAIVGPDYVDVDGNGPSEKDLGYWIKFNYLRTTSAYKWRTPFSGASFAQGFIQDQKDDKGQFQYGEKRDLVPGKRRKQVAHCRIPYV